MLGATISENAAVGLLGSQNPAGGSAGPTAKTGGEGKLRGKKIASRFPEGRGGPTAVLGNPGGTAAGNMGAQPPDATISENAAAGSRGAKPRREAGGGARGNWCPRETHRRCHLPYAASAARAQWRVMICTGSSRANL